MRAVLRAFLPAAAGMLLALPAHALELEGYPVPASISLGGRTLVLNGAAVRRFSIYKVEVASLYLPARQATLEAATALAGPKRLQLVMLRDARSDDIARKFMSDFRAVSQPGEWNNLMNEMAALGSMLHNNVKKGDVLTIDWLPGSGLVIARNATPLSDKPIASELMFRIIMRIFLGPIAPEDARLKLLGVKPNEE